MPRLLFAFLSVVVALPAALFAADPAAEMAGFSVFPTVDLAAVQKTVRTARGPASGVARHLSVQSCYVVPGTPAKALDTLQNWDPTRHSELHIAVHTELSANPAPGDFTKFSSGGDAGSSFAKATEKLSPDLQISRDEAKKYGPGKEAPFKDFWPPLLSARAAGFAAGGAAHQPAYDFTGQEIKPGEELAALLSNQPKIKAHFGGFLSECGALGKPSLKEEHYAELLKAGDDGAVTLGAFASKPAGGGFQAADVLYYSSGGYCAALTLYQAWLVEVGMQVSATLIGALTCFLSLASLHGVERTGAESVMMKEISRSVNFLKSDTAGR